MLTMTYRRWSQEELELLWEAMVEKEHPYKIDQVRDENDEDAWEVRCQCGWVDLFASETEAQDAADDHVERAYYEAQIPGDDW